MKLMTIVGARPQFIKAAAVAKRRRALAESGGAGAGGAEAGGEGRAWRDVLIHTGQHFDANMSDVFFQELALPPPDHNLGVGAGGHGAQTGAMLAKLEAVMQDDPPDRVLVYGDTNSTLAGALAAAKLGIPVAHVEAGLRSFRRAMAEEINRVLTDRLSDLLFCPTETAVENLRREGMTAGVELVGDVMFDVYRWIAADSDPGAALAALGLASNAAPILATLHRAENVDDPDRLAAIVAGLGRLAADRPVLLPVHPRTRGRLDQFGLALPAAITRIDPLPYKQLVAVLEAASCVVTDSGGLQKEAAFSRTPCVTVREETEWLETLSGGWNRLAPAEVGAIEAAVAAAMREPKGDPPYYGDGDAAGAILRHIDAVTAA